MGEEGEREGAKGVKDRKGDTEEGLGRGARGVKKKKGIEK